MKEIKLHNKKQRSLKLNRGEKQYPASDSPLYKLRSKRKLAAHLGASLQELKILASDNNYVIFNEGRSGKKREVHQPKPNLDKVHTRIGCLLSRITPPNYLHSGVKGRTHITNAKCHRPSSKMLVTDIKSFYQSTTFEMVYGYFHNYMQCSPDVSWILASISTYKNAIPTGSRLSMPLAFWSNISMFDKLNQASMKENITMTLYVDDLTFSGDTIGKRFKNKVQNIVSSHGHTCHPEKTKLYKASQTKLVTGVALSPSGASVSNKQHKSIYEDLVQWELTKNKFTIESLNNRLLGKLNSQGQIDPRYKDKARSLRNEIKRKKHQVPHL